MTRAIAVLAVTTWLAIPGIVGAQPLGTFRWQLQPYCNVVSLTVTQVGAQYRVEGTDDQCGAGRDLASAIGMAFQNPDGTIGFGLTIVVAPGGAAVNIDAEISLATLSGTWRDSTGATGTFAFRAGAGTGGTPRPQPGGTVPSAIRLLGDGSVVAGGSGGTAIPATGPGVRMMWYPGKAAFRAGHVRDTEWNDANIGPSSVALGLDTVASGYYSTAFGDATRASGSGSTALGTNTRAMGEISTAMGLMTTASGYASTAMGQDTVASGITSTAMGAGTVASGQGSIAIGARSTASGGASFAGGLDTSASGEQAFAFGAEARAAGLGSVALGRSARTTATGSFMFADRSTSDPFQSNAPNEFGARFAGGFYLYTRADLGTGVALAASGSSWAALSDVNAKENFRDVDGEELLAKLARIPIREWNYKAQDTAIRHMGPTAQDFRAAFGLGDFLLRINTIDADGLALAGVQALEARTRELREENALLRAALIELRGQVERLLEEGRAR
jgi:hypothetical protein